MGHRVGQQYDPVLLNLDNAAGDLKAYLGTLFISYYNRACVECGDDRCVILQDLERPFSSGYPYRPHLAGIDAFVRCDNLYLHVWFLLTLPALGNKLLALGDCILNCTDEHECGLGILIHCAVNNHVEASDRILYGDKFAWYVGKLLGHVEGL